MPRPGGESDKLGNHFESVWTVDKVLDVFTGLFESITVEALGVEGRGVEFHLEQFDKSLQFHSVKRQKQGGDWSVANLCSADKKTGRSILGDLFQKCREHPGAEIRFVSSTGANDLRELSERSVSPTDVGEFKRSLSVSLNDKFCQRIVPSCGGDEIFALEAIKSLEVILRSHQDLICTVDQRIGQLFYRIDQSALLPGDVRRMLAEFILENLGRKIDPELIREILSKNQIGHRDWKFDATVNERVKSINRRYLSVTEAELINSAHIARDVVDQIIEAIGKDTSKGALLVAPGGFGKSCILAQCVAQFSASGTPFICLRMDSLEPCQSTKKLGEQLDLPASPVRVLAGIADNEPSVLIVDQLDAMSIVSGRHLQMWEVFSELRNEAWSYPQMKMILACRDFDLNHDQRLRGLSNPASGFTNYSLDKLSSAAVRASLDDAGHKELKLDERQMEILGVPFHLLLFLEGEPSRSFRSASELYDRYWNRKRQNLKSRLGRESHWNAIIDSLTQRMSEDQVLFAPSVLVDEWVDDARAMVSEHVLVEVQSSSQYRFFHESFFDYAYARRFCASERSLVAFLESGEQHLFRRAQVRQILAFRRENDFGRYIMDLRQIFGSQTVRFHVKRMVATGLSRIDTPTAEEWKVVEPYLLEGDLSRPVSTALRDHGGWFDRLNSLGVFENWLSSNDARLNHAAIWFLESMGLQDIRSTPIAKLITPYTASKDDEWRQRILRIMSWGKAHKSSEMAKIFLEMLDRGTFDDYQSDIQGADFWTRLDEAGKESPRFVITVFGKWFNRMVELFDDGETPNFLDKSHHNRSHCGALLVSQVATAEPEYFVEQMLARVSTAVLRSEASHGDRTVSRLWPWLSNHDNVYDVDDAILLSLRKSLQFLAKNDADCFRSHARTILKHPHEIFGYLLLRSWADSPREFADECAEYMIADPRRLFIGYSSWSGNVEGSGESAISRLALRGISPHCSEELFCKLESRIIGYCGKHEMQTPRWRGSSELLVLRSLDGSRISKRTALRIEELERKFPVLSDVIVEEDKTGLLRATGSPIPQHATEIMTDSQWISAMRKYDGSIDRRGGGPNELSRSLSNLARRDQRRFSTLAQLMPDDINPLYFSALLDGMCGRYAGLSKEERDADQKDVEATPTEVFLEVIDRLHALPNKPCGSAIMHCVNELSRRRLPLRVMETVVHYAVNDADPESDIWKQSVNGSKFYGGDPYDHGINCVRGQAAWTIATLLYDDDGSRVDALRPALVALSQDPVISVRTCAIDAYLPLINTDRDWAVELFLAACDQLEEICATRPFEKFIHIAVSSHYSQLRDLLQFATSSDNADAVERAARQVILAELGGVDVGDDAARIRTGSEAMRKAAADVYARNLSDREVGDKCYLHLEEFFHDEAESVRLEVSSAFFDLSGERLLALSGFIDRYIESKSFETDAYRLLGALEKSNVELPKVICRSAERILDVIGEEGTHIAYHGSMIAHQISTLIVRQYEQARDESTKIHCLDLIDQMERVGYLGIDNELNRIDR